jgi:hypothetical protein
MLPWQQLVSAAFRSGRLPLWNPYSLGGSPLLANGQSAPFSLFTWVALPFDPAHGASLAMLLKMWVAGTGVAVFVRILGSSWLGAATAGLAFATSSYMVVWLGWPHTSVAALVPWSFAAAEWYIRSRKPMAGGALAATLALQFLAGHPETTEHFVGALAVYCVVRVAASHGYRWRLAVGLSAAAIVGLLIAGVQLIPFVFEVRQVSFVTQRAATHLGSAHLPLNYLLSWLVPNGHGNPGIDGQAGRMPNYNEATAFVGVAALFLAPLGALRLWRIERSAALGLILLTLLSFGTVYGLLSPLVGILPGLSVTANTRSSVVACFGLAALAGLGLDAVLAGGRHGHRTLSTVILAIGAFALSVLLAAGVLVATRHQYVDTLLPPIRSNIGFWVAVSCASAAAAGAFALSSRLGRARAAATGFSVLVLLEGLIFALPYNHRLPRDEVPPPSQAVDWLRANAPEEPLVATGSVLTPNTSVYYRLRDMRGYDVVLSPRSGLFWSLGDPSYAEIAYHTTLSNPGIQWLRAAGVGEVMTPQGQELPGTLRQYVGEGVSIARVPDPRPFAFTVESITSVATVDAAMTALRDDPLGSVAVEGGSVSQPGNPSARAVEVSRPAPESIDVKVDVPTRATLIILQTYDPGWSATVDAKKVPVKAADIAFQAVEVPAGNHTVMLRYTPAGVPLGAAASAVGLLGLALFVGGPRMRRRRSAIQPLTA